VRSVQRSITVINMVAFVYLHCNCKVGHLLPGISSVGRPDRAAERARNWLPGLRSCFTIVCKFRVGKFNLVAAPCSLGIDVP